MTVAVDQRSPGVPPGEAGLGLEHVFPWNISVIIDVTADRSSGERPQSSLLGVADRYNRVTDGNEVGIGKLQNREKVADGWSPDPKKCQVQVF